MLPRDVIQAMATFMQRVDLKGSEVPAFQRCMMALHVEEQAAIAAENAAKEKAAEVVEKAA